MRIARRGADRLMGITGTPDAGGAGGGTCGIHQWSGAGARVVVVRRLNGVPVAQGHEAGALGGGPGRDAGRPFKVYGYPIAGAPAINQAAGQLAIIAKNDAGTAHIITWIDPGRERDRIGIEVPSGKGDE